MQLKLKDGRVVQGTARQIVSAMRDVSQFSAAATLDEYVGFVQSNTQGFEGVSLDVKGETEDERCASLVDELVRTGLAERL
jgi:hypothetical protein